jgi:thioredoxin reductase (NADPH)
VFIVGAANSAGQAALHLAETSDVTIVCRGDSIARSMSQYLVERIESHERITVRMGAQIVEAHGDTHLEGVTIEEGGERTHHDASGLFVFIGAEPHTEWLGRLVARSERGFVLSGADIARGGAENAPPWPLARDPYLLETNVPGIFVAGDVRDQSIKRVASAVGEGAMAVAFIHQYLREL